MGRYVRKCKGSSSVNIVGEIAVTIGVSTRARAALLTMAEKKMKKVSTSNTTPYNVYQLRSRRKSVAASKETAPEDEEGANCSASSEIITATTTSYGSDFPPSCCSSNISSSSNGVVLDRTSEIVADPEQVESARIFDCSAPAACKSEEEEKAEEKVIKPVESDGMDSPAKSTVQIKMPSDSEIDDFFSAAEKDLQKRFSDKYNFDIVKEVPLEGRYEWVPMKP